MSTPHGIPHERDSTLNANAVDDLLLNEHGVAVDRMDDSTLAIWDGRRKLVLARFRTGGGVEVEFPSENVPSEK